MIEIQLTQKQIALIDDTDYGLVKPFKWFANWTGQSYRVIAYNTKTKRHIQISRLIMQPPEGFIVDHKNGDPLDNRRENLRVCTHSQNAANRGKRLGSTSSKFIGVSAKRAKWRASIKKDGIYFHIGTFLLETEAAKAYDNMARELHGEFARLNFPEETGELDRGVP